MPEDRLLLISAYLTGQSVYLDRDPGMLDDSRQKIRSPVQAVEFSEQYAPQLHGIVGHEVRQPSVLGVLPYDVPGT